MKKARSTSAKPSQEARLESTVKPSEKTILIATAAIMGLAVIFREWSDILAAPFALLIILDVLTLTGTITSEIGKRLIIFFSILATLVTVWYFYLLWRIGTGGLTF